MTFGDHGGVVTGHSVYIAVTEETLWVLGVTGSLHGVYLNSRS